MESFVALWTLRFALIGAVAISGVSISAGTPVVDAVDRGLIAAVVFTFVGQWLLDRLEAPEIRIARMRARRAAKRGKAKAAPTTPVVAPAPRGIAA